MDRDLEGRVALVTGAGSGIGRATALRLAQAGARVGVLTHTGEEAHAVAAEIAKAGGRALALVADVAEDAAMAAALHLLVEHFGRLDIVFANAGINGVWAPIDKLSCKEWDRTMAVNARGTFLTLHHSVPHLKRQGGAIIVTASINGSRTFSNSGATAYACSKAAQVAMVQMLAPELGEHRIRINAICPGHISTEISENTEKRELEGLGLKVEYPEGSIPLTRHQPGTPEDVAELVLFLASDAARHITGTPVWIDGGQSLIM